MESANYIISSKQLDASLSMPRHTLLIVQGLIRYDEPTWSDGFIATVLIMTSWWVFVLKPHGSRGTLNRPAKLSAGKSSIERGRDLSQYLLAQIILAFGHNRSRYVVGHRTVHESSNVFYRVFPVHSSHRNSSICKYLQNIINGISYPSSTSYHVTFSLR